MSTKGIYGFRYDGMEKITYNHSDSYPQWLGVQFIEFLNQHTVEELRNFFNNIIMVDENEIPNQQEFEQCKKLGLVNNEQIENWHETLRVLQGNFFIYNKCINNNTFIYMTDNKGFLKCEDCEYGYIFDLNISRLEYYKAAPNHKRKSKLAKTFSKKQLANVQSIIDKMSNI